MYHGEYQVSTISIAGPAGDWYELQLIWNRMQGLLSLHMIYVISAFAPAVLKGSSNRKLMPAQVLPGMKRAAKLMKEALGEGQGVSSVLREEVDACLHRTCHLTRMMLQMCIRTSPTLLIC